MIKKQISSIQPIEPLEAKLALAAFTDDVPHNFRKFLDTKPEKTALERWVEETNTDGKTRHADLARRLGDAAVTLQGFYGYRIEWEGSTPTLHKLSKRGSMPV